MDALTERTSTLSVGGHLLPLPCLFPSISSVKSNLSPAEYLRVLVATDYPCFLISAYDIHHATPRDRRKISKLLTMARTLHKVTLLDSGNYESYWLRDRAWTTRKFQRVLRMESPQMALCYDDQRPRGSASAIAKKIEASVLSGQANLPDGTVVPIVHSSAPRLLETIRAVVVRLRPILVAIPERLLGDGLVERAETIVRIRAILDGSGYYCPVHLLGTGNPLSILIYSVCGADSFDGLEWCQTVVDHGSGRLYHFQQWDFFKDQTPIAKMPATIPYAHKVLVHNLIFYGRWMQMLQDALVKNEGAALIPRFLPPAPAEAIQRLLKRHR